METLLNFNQQIMMKNKIGGFKIYGGSDIPLQSQMYNKNIEIALIVKVLNSIGYIKLFYINRYKMSSILNTSKMAMCCSKNISSSISNLDFLNAFSTEELN